jgi:hypothetical protein
MARAKKKTLSQNVVNAATTGMPSPVRNVLGNRIVALLVVVTLPILYMSGVISFDWQNGRPHLTVDREKAELVREEAAEAIHEFEERREGDHDDRPHLFSQENSKTPVVERLAKAVDETESERNSIFDLAPDDQEPESATETKHRPGERLKKMFDGRRR